MNSRLLLPILLALALAGCARGSDTTADPGPGTTAAVAPSATARITPGALAVLVDEHLGAENVRGYGSYGSDRQEVGVMVRLEGAGRRDMFSVSVYGPGHPETGAMGGGPCGGCRALERPPATQCEELSGGGLATVSSIPYGFSDDNLHGSVLMAAAYTPPKGMAIAMYESYTAKVPVDDAELLALMSDARLAWETDAELVEAGRDVAVRRLRG